MNGIFKSSIVGLAAISFVGMGSVARAVELVQNGNFSSTTNGPGQLGFGTNLTGWTNNNSGYNFVFAPDTADIVPGLANSFGNTLSLWGPRNGSNNGLTATSPAGGNFIAADGDTGLRGAISQTLNGLVVGQQYLVSFYDAGAQQYNFGGATTEQWQVSFGNQTQLSTLFSIPDRGCSGWQQEFLTFTANNTSETLSFLANGTPNGLPPFSLLSGVSVQAVPEPFTIIGTIVGGTVALRLRKRLAQQHKQSKS